MKNIGLAIGGVFIIVFSCMAGVIGGFLGSRIPAGSALGDLTNTLTQEVRVTDEQSAIIDVANTSTPSVVSIVVSKDVSKYYNNRYFDDSWFNNNSSETELQQIGSGSGFVINSDGMIITNRHVVEDADASYTVVFNDGKQVEATVLARDTILDIAFLKVEGVENLTALNLGSSTNLKVGQTVIAIGNALGEFSNTVSSGIISGLSRNIVASDSQGANQESLENVIQTDASINPGNSGGPLLDIEGNVIGVNVAVANAENIGFAIPIDTIKDLISKLNAQGQIERPALGVRYVMVDQTVQEEESLSVDYGALVVKGNSAAEVAVVKNSPAEKAGIKEGDVILEVNGEKIDSDNTLVTIIQKFKVGDTVKVKVLTNGTEKELTITLEKAS